MLFLDPGVEIVPGYRLVRLLGRGAYGQVWAAEDRNQLQVALKLVSLGGGAGDKELRSLHWIKNIRHANLLPITGIWLLNQNGTVSDMRIQDLGSRATNPPSTLVLGMPLAERSLMDVLDEHQERGSSGVPLDDLLPYMDDAARGIDFLNSSRHKLGDEVVSIQHRDIKPDNIMLLGGVAVVADLGIARALHDQSVAATRIGSPAYMAPEYMHGDTTKMRGDQYSLAMTYYHLRTGSLPFPPGANPA